MRLTNVTFSMYNFGQ